MMKRYIAILGLAALLFQGCADTDKIESPVQYSLETSTKTGRAIVGGAPDYFGHVKYDAEKKLGQGVSLLDLGYLNTNGYAGRMLVFKVNLEEATIRISTPGNDTNFGRTATLAEQFEALENSGEEVLGGVNADSYTAATLQPTGIVWRGGSVAKGSFDGNGGFFGILKDGSAVIGSQSEYKAYSKSLYAAAGTQETILQNGYPVASSDTKATARTFVAVDEAGTTLWLGVVDGVNFYCSNGITVADLASVLAGAGAKEAALLQGGDASVVLARGGLSDESPFTVKNNPAGATGKVSGCINGLAIVSL